jgi:hypothetical protein
MNYIKEPPQFLICNFCNQEVKSYQTVNSNAVQYKCCNHEDLIIGWWCVRKPPNEWYISNMTITLLPYYRLYLDFIKNDKFYLHEYRKQGYLGHSPPGGWFFVETTFPIDWVLSQTPERLLSLLQMYKTFS